ncbi:MAG: hypothetical protein KKE17_00610 [Proteobacteria bacterium]|nr:hypothetical protein [Pseudomonadota bacterium]MBU1708483.1 hypothetical protein [Pseudomonadota bacterium]
MTCATLVAGAVLHMRKTTRMPMTLDTIGFLCCNRRQVRVFVGDIGSVGLIMCRHRMAYFTYTVKSSIAIGKGIRAGLIKKLNINSVNLLFNQLPINNIEI